MRGSEMLDRQDMKKFKVSDIIWDTDDGCCPDFDCCVVEVSRADLVECPTEDSFVALLSDILSDTYGFTVMSFTYEQL